MMTGPPLNGSAGHHRALCKHLSVLCSKVPRHCSGPLSKVCKSEFYLVFPSLPSTALYCPSSSVFVSYSVWLEWVVDDSLVCSVVNFSLSLKPTFAIYNAVTSSICSASTSQQLFHHVRLVVLEGEPQDTPVWSI